MKPSYEEREVSEKAVRAANKILAGGAVVALLILFYFIYYYGYTSQRQFTSLFGVIIYYVLPSLVAILLLASLRLTPGHRFNLAIFCVATAVSLYVGELLLRSWQFVRDHWVTSEIIETSDRTIRARVAKKFGVNFDTRSNLEVISDFRRKGIDAVPTVGPSVILSKDEDGSVRSKILINGKEVIPLSGVANKTTAFCNENGEYTIYESDEHGFHNPKGIWESGRLDVAALGDSFTHGACVPSDKNFVALIRNRYPATLNLGIKGMGPLLEFAVLKEYLPYVKPKVVLWFYFEKNDFLDLDKEKRSTILTRYLENGFRQGLFYRQEEIDREIIDLIKQEMIKEITRQAAQVKNKRNVFSHVDDLLDVIKLGTLRQKTGFVYGRERVEQGGVPEFVVSDMALFRRILLLAKTTVGAWEGSLYFIYLPEWERYARPDVATKNRDEVLKLVRNLRLPLIDLHAAFQAHGDPLSLFPFRGFGHYNELGHRIVAETIIRSISLTNRDS